MKRHSTSWNIRYVLNIYARFAMLSVFLRLYEVPAFPNNQLKRHCESGQGTGTQEERGEKRHTVRVRLKRFLRTLRLLSRMAIKALINQGKG